MDHDRRIQLDGSVLDVPPQSDKPLDKSPKSDRNFKLITGLPEQYEEISPNGPTDRQRVPIIMSYIISHDHGKFRRQHQPLQCWVDEVEPQPANPWTEILDCTDEGGKPWQNLFKTPFIMGDEDCLFVNVYTRDVTPAKLRPVMVWIHGGGFVSGSTSKDFQSPDFLLNKDVVYVSLAYRLCIFGFLSLKDPTLKVPGNAGLKDLVLGLRWVKANISRFGGDPENITIFGLSAGGAAVHYLGLTEQTKGLFNRMIVMSGTAFCPWANVPPKDWGHRVAKRLGYKGDDSEEDILKFLRTMKPKKIIGAEVKSILKEESWNGCLFTAYPVVEPYVTDQCVLPEEPVVLACTAWSNDIPVITGCTSKEGLLFQNFMIPGYQDAWKKDPTMLLPFDIKKADQTNNQVRNLAEKLSNKTFPNGDYGQTNFIDYMSYFHFVHPVHRMIRSRQKYASAPTYLYIFDFDSPKYSIMKQIGSIDIPGVSHGDDLAYLFLMAINAGMSKDSREAVVRNLYVGLMTKFATDGDPNCQELGTVKWEPVKGEGSVHKCLRIANKVTFEDNPFADILKNWDDLYEEVQ